MTIIPPDPIRFSRLGTSHADTIPVVRELPSLPKSGLALGPSL